jgi:hypothetical protein
MISQICSDMALLETEVSTIVNEVSFNTSGATGPRDSKTIVKEVKSKTGRIWMDRNLGATGVSSSSPKYANYGDLYQWGRGADGHQAMIWTDIYSSAGTTSPKGTAIDTSRTTIKSTTDSPGHSKFILSWYFNISLGATKEDWREPKNDNLWQGNNGINNPCPVGFRLPTYQEAKDELSSWGPNIGAIGLVNFGPISPYPSVPVRDTRYGETSKGGGANGLYWTSTVLGDNVYVIDADNRKMSITSQRGMGICVRCIKD